MLECSGSGLGTTTMMDNELHVCEHGITDILMCARNANLLDTLRYGWVILVKGRRTSTTHLERPSARGDAKAEQPERTMRCQHQ